MSAQRYFNEIIKDKMNSQSGYGYECKQIVDAMLEADSVYTLAKVVSETSSKYDVWLKILDTNIYLKIYNSSANLYYQHYYGIDGASIGSNTSQGNFLDSSNGTYKIVISRLGDSMFSVILQSTATNNSMHISFAKVFSEYTGKNYCVPATGTNSASFGSYNMYSSYPGQHGYFVEDDTGNLFSVSNISSNNSSVSDYIKATGSVGVLLPVSYGAYHANNKYWFGHLKWDGKYDLYALYNGNGMYSISPNAEYIVDGKTYKGLFNALIIPVEC